MLVLSNHEISTSLTAVELPNANFLWHAVLYTGIHLLFEYSWLCIYT